MPQGMWVRVPPPARKYFFRVLKITGFPMDDKQKNIERKSLKVEILEKMGALVTTGFGIVAALAWNDFIRALFARVFPEPGNNLLAMLGYAVVVTVLIVLLTVQIGRLLDRAKKMLNRAENDDSQRPKGGVA
ncbi:MAG: DUF5654 family protein [Patescibacteria group bacterium]|nr:DUF5654 family protein [Patescibacteria group bacterium]